MAFVSRRIQAEISEQICTDLARVGTRAMPMQCFFHIMTIADLWPTLDRKLIYRKSDQLKKLIALETEMRPLYGQQHKNFRIGLELLLDPEAPRDFKGERPAILQFVENIWNKHLDALLPGLPKNSAL